MKILSLTLSLTFAVLSAKALAHSVSASTVEVIVDGNRMEIWQTTPRGTASNVAISIDSSLEKSREGVTVDENILAGMAKGWVVSNEKGSCSVEKQAFRRLHHDTQIQLRYLYTCADGRRPQKIYLPWLLETPGDHFITLNMKANGRSDTKIFADRQLTINVPAESPTNPNTVNRIP